MLEISPNGQLIAFRKVQGDTDLVVVYSLQKKEMVTGVNVSDINPQDLYFISDDYLVMTAFERKSMRRFRAGEVDISSAFALNTTSG